MPKQLHIHVHTPALRGFVADRAPKVVRFTDDALRDLVDALMAAVARRNSETKDDAQVGHPFYGNQYTDVVLGPKPTSSTAKGSKGAVHELLSSGHPFTLEELMAATGAKNILTLTTAISDLKNPKYAGPHGVLNIVKHKHTGHYYVDKSATPAAATPPTKPEPPPSKVEPVELAAVQPPAVKMTKEEADQQYAHHMNAAHIYVKDAMDAGKTPEEVALNWKKMRSTAMAQWKANTSGQPVKPKPVEVFAEDLVLMGDLWAAVNDEQTAKAFADWKKATSEAKSKPKAAPPPPAPPPTPKPVAAAPSLPKLKPGEFHAPVLKAPSVDELVPDDHDHATKHEFDSGKFAHGISHAKETLWKDGGDSVNNKKKVDKALTDRLKDSPAFQWLTSKIPKEKLQHGSPVATLISAWAGSSGDGHAKSVALQLAVRDAFGMKPEHLEMKRLHAIEDAGGEDQVYRKAMTMMGIPTPTAATPSSLENFKSALRDFVVAQYHETQEHLKAKGLTHLHLARGMDTGNPSSTAEKVKLKLQPASSFSTSKNTAHGFSKGTAIFYTKVPASQVLSHYHTGFGCTSEHEVVVLSHPRTTAVQTHPYHHAGTMKAIADKITQEVPEWS